MSDERTTSPGTHLVPVRRLWVRERFGHGRKQTTATAWLDRFEWDATLIARNNGYWLGLMGHESDNDGRSITEAPGVVNGTEVRWSERWLQPTDPTEDYETVWAILPDGSRAPFTAHLQADEDASTQARKPLTEAELDAIDRDARRAAQRIALGTQADVD